MKPGSIPGPGLITMSFCGFLRFPLLFLRKTSCCYSRQTGMLCERGNGNKRKKKDKKGWADGVRNGSRMGNGQKKGVQQEDFPRGHPPEYYSHPNTFNFRVLMGYGALVLVWSHQWAQARAIVISASKAPVRRIKEQWEAPLLFKHRRKRAAAQGSTTGTSERADSRQTREAAQKGHNLWFNRKIFRSCRPCPGAQVFTVFCDFPCSSWGKPCAAILGRWERHAREERVAGEKKKQGRGRWRSRGEQHGKQTKRGATRGLPGR